MAKNILTYFIVNSVAIILLISCSKENINEPIDNNLFDKQNEVKEYFKEIALGFEFGTAAKVTRKWKEDIKIYLDGEFKDEILEEAEPIISQLN